MVDPDSIEQNHLIAVQHALVASHEWFVVDRSDAFAAAVKEQNLEHGAESEERFSDPEKWSHMAKLFGIRGVIIAKAQCSIDRNWLGRESPICHQYLSLVDANTAVVVASVESVSVGEEGHYSVSPPWTKVVSDLYSEFRKYYEANPAYAKEVREYQARSIEEAKKDKKQVPVRLPASSSSDDD
jgi:hypothetical protein